MSTLLGIAAIAAALVGIAVLWTFATTQPARDPYEEPHGDVPVVPP